MAKKYANPPLIEAVCEFRLTPDTAWDLTIPGLMYEKVEKEFPNKEQRLIQEVEIIQSPQGMQQQTRTVERVLFLTRDRKIFIQAGPHLLAVNCLKPYPTWNGFKPRIENAFRSLTEIVDIKGLQRIGLRYINHIEIPARSINLEEYFEFRPFLGQNLPQNIANFIVGCVWHFSNGRDSCRVQITNALPEKPDNTAFLLDLDYFLAQPKAVSVNQALEWVEEAHQKVEEIFEGCITEPVREIFREIK
ncbi:MAG: TIGR04255 family protein [Chloroflexi bacterium]|nr:TIGR04255 family protein [Chloroflexota bacterium]